MKIGWVDNFARQGVKLTIEKLLATKPPNFEIVQLLGSHFDRLCDLYICTDISECSHPNWDFIANHPHIFYLQDYMLMPYEWQRLRVAQMISTANLVIFQSPMHQEEFTRLHHGLRRLKYPSLALCPATVDTSLFFSLPGDEEHPKQKRKRSSVLWAGGSFSPRKGIQLAVDWATENDEYVDFYAYGKPPTFLTESKHCKVKDPVPYEYMPGVFQQYKKFLYLPVWKEPFGRVVAEAMLMGLEIITNDNVGIFSYPWGRNPLLVKRYLDEAPSAFWNAISKYTEKIKIRRW